jgi:hypothetical protein
MAWEAGEDFVVQVYHKGAPSGITFYIQLKSTTNLDGLTRKDGYARCRLEVAHLARWDGFAVPVIVVLWDINKREGCWLDTIVALTELDHTNPAWRRQEKVTVRIPRANGTDDVGLERLRLALAFRCIPMVARGRTLEGEFLFRFPKTAEGQTARDGVMTARATGDGFTIPGPLLRSVKFKGWAAPLVGEIDLSRGRLEARTATSSVRLPLQLQAISTSGATATVPYVELSVLKAGFSQATYSNEQTQDPLHLRVVYDKDAERSTFVLKLVGPGKNVDETASLLHFMTTLAEGGILRITYLRENRSQELKAAPGQFASPPPELLVAVEKLCVIQGRTGIALALGPDWSFGPTGPLDIDQVRTVTETGRLVASADVCISLPKSGIIAALEAHCGGEPWVVTWEDSAMKAVVLGIDIPLGPVSCRVTGVPATPLDELRAALPTGDDDVPVPLNVNEADIVMEFPDWLPKGG